METIIIPKVDITGMLIPLTLSNWLKQLMHENRPVSHGKLSRITICIGCGLLLGYNTVLPCMCTMWRIPRLFSCVLRTTLLTTHLLVSRLMSLVCLGYGMIPQSGRQVIIVIVHVSLQLMSSLICSCLSPVYVVPDMFMSLSSLCRP